MRTRALRSALLALVVVPGLLGACAYGGTAPTASMSGGTGASTTPPPSTTPSAESAYSATGPLGLQRFEKAPTPYLSGVWIGGKPYAAHWSNFEEWRGAPLDAVLGYNDYASWESMPHSGNISLFRSFSGTLVYGLGILPVNGEGSLRDVAEGKHDNVWRATAEGLVTNGKERSIVRIGFEANGTWFPWGATAKTAEDYKAAFRRVAQLLREGGANPIIGFDVGCGVGLSGDRDRLAPLTRLYPGDDIVDVIGCDVYDNSSIGYGNPAALGVKTKGPSLLETLAFAKQHRKPLVVPEWGLDRTYGRGDNPDFINTMYRFFDEHAQHIALELYFNEGTTDIKSSLWEPNQNPRAAAAYSQIWHRRMQTGARGAHGVGGMQADE